jgi:4-amino-4-deoxy-L-arabinose transferase-like glycosyltransferase
MAFALSSRERRCLLGFVVAVVVVRVATLGAYPLMDTTESRYAEIARKMLETGDWLMPQFDYGLPFWGKPPLSTWLSALAMSAFGVNEFAARLPSAAALAGCGALVYALAALRGGRDQALWTLALFASLAMVFVAAGAVMTDPALMLGTTLSMAGFWIAINAPDNYGRVAGYGFFAGLAVGLLAKGPIVAILALAPIGAWMLWTRSLRSVWRGLPWLSGSLLAIGVAGAWYWAAERATPGFLEYFLVGEHWKRFVEPGWTGDRYGRAHIYPHGTIWLLWIVAALPWSAVALALLARAARAPSAWRAFAADPWRVYFALWAITPMAFFTLAGNILITYVLPSLPAFVLLIGEAWRPESDGFHGLQTPAPIRTEVFRMIAAGAVLPAVFAVGAILLRGSFEAERSQKALVHAYQSARPGNDSRLVYFLERPDSAQFYARGRSLKVLDWPAFHALLDEAPSDIFAIRESEISGMPPGDRARLEPLGSYGDYRLLREMRR